VLSRADRLARPATALPLAAFAEHDGWCDAPGDANYSRPVRLPYPASAERLARRGL
jgi:L,D-peptidoglycan transpeptidase YkuD (ErfK/YbiS/YcfS/YnhG family)